MLRLGGRGGVDTPFGTRIGSGLDARLVADLAQLTPESLVTPNDRFFIRTSYPDLIDPTQPWRITIGGLAGAPVALALPDLQRRMSPMGVHLIECAGNANPNDFGLMSAATWSGVRLTDVLTDVERRPAHRRLLVSGADAHSRASQRSSPGASWIFTLDELSASGAFLALEMNGERLPRDQGFPVRLVVPGWYGCASIKWVNEIRFVSDDEPATPHMLEFAARTHQREAPALARDFAPALVDAAAMPIRIERWRIADGSLHRVVGLAWGGDRPIDKLLLRITPGPAAQAVEVCPPRATSTTWGLWTCEWRPPAPGRYEFVVRAADASVRTRRLDLYYYARSVWIEQV